MKRDQLVYLYDMLRSAEKGIQFVEDYSYESFVKDDKTQFALIRAIEIIGEASKKVPYSIKSQTPEFTLERHQRYA